MHILVRLGRYLMFTTKEFDRNKNGCDRQLEL